MSVVHVLYRTDTLFLEGTLHYDCSTSSLWQRFATFFFFFSMAASFKVCKILRHPNLKCKNINVTFQWEAWDNAHNHLNELKVIPSLHIRVPHQIRGPPIHQVAHHNKVSPIYQSLSITKYSQSPLPKESFHQSG